MLSTVSPMIKNKDTWEKYIKTRDIALFIGVYSIQRVYQLSQARKETTRVREECTEVRWIKRYHRKKHSKRSKTRS